MARSEYIGDTCLACKVIWTSKDFERLEIIDAEFFDEKEGLMNTGQFWKIRCNVCGRTGLYLYFATLK